jgi:hypothetical protein
MPESTRLLARHARQRGPVAGHHHQRQHEAFDRNIAQGRISKDRHFEERARLTVSFATLFARCDELFRSRFGTIKLFSDIGFDCFGSVDFNFSSFAIALL